MTALFLSFQAKYFFFLSPALFTKERKKNFSKQTTMRTWQLKNLWAAAKAVLREVYCNTILLQETRKTSNKQPNFIPKATEERGRKKPQN